MVPDSSVTGPTGNRIAPMIRDTADTSRHAASPKITTAAYLTDSSRVRPAGTVSR